MNVSFARHVVFAASLLLFPWATPARARVYSPRVVSPHNADAYSMRTFAQFHRWKDLEGDARAQAVFEYLTDKRTGLYPLGAGAWEGTVKTYDFGLVRDPVKMINVYSLGYCDVFGPVMEGIWEDAGFGRARTVNIPEWSHVASEVFYDGKWHYLDLDLRAIFLDGEGRLASLEEARTNPKLWDRPPGPRFFPNDDLAKVREIYANSKIEHRYGVHQSGHTMDFMLRRGETFTRWWTPQGGRWNHADSYHTDPARRRILDAAPRGPKSKHAGFTVHTHGNGRFVYAPNLKAPSSDFADGFEQVDNVAPGKEGLTVAKAGSGSAVFEVRTPYVIVPKIGAFPPAKKDPKAKKPAGVKLSEASVLEIDAAKSTKVDVSTDGGSTWVPLPIKKWPARVDLTDKVAGRYGYLLRLTVRGKLEEVLVRSLKLTTWVQLAPASLPSLRAGTNRMRLVTGDHYGLPTRVLELCPDASNTTDFFRQLVTPPTEYDPASRTSRVQGPFVVRLAAPVGSKVAWFTAGGSFKTYQLEQAAKTNNTISYATGAPADFQEIYRAEVPTDQAHWHYNAHREVRLDEPAETVYLKYVGDPAVNNIRIYAHCLEEAPPPATPVHVRHVWREKDEQKTFETTLNGAGEYTIEAGDDPVDELIEMSVPSDG